MHRRNPGKNRLPANLFALRGRQRYNPLPPVSRRYLHAHRSCVLQAITFDVFADVQEDSQCFIINGPAFAQLSERSPQVKIFALETAVNRFSDVMWVMQQILFMSMDKRLAIFLSDEIARTGLNSVHLTHEQIARYIGSAREVVSRMLKYFASEGIVEISRKGIRILNKPKLYALARYSGGNKK